MQQQAWDATHPVLILGCGYIGLAVAREILQQGGKVVAVKRTAHTQSEKVLAHPNLTWIHADLAEAQCL
ncbi:MAG: NAD-dependent epimerase/dehydratase family protein, partial [Verrucomicrobiota bacterium]